MNLHIVSDYPAEATRASVIQLQNVSVLYRLPQERIATFKEYAIRFMQRRIRYKEFWALRNINLDIKKGEVFGVIGKNGAGKTAV